MTTTAANHVEFPFSIAGTGEIGSSMLLITLEHPDDYWVASINSPASEYGGGKTALEAMKDLFSSLVDYAGLLERHPDMVESDRAEIIRWANLLEPKRRK